VIQLARLIALHVLNLETIRLDNMNPMEKKIKHHLIQHLCEKRAKQ
jgi:predicted RNA-binding protein Jag